MEDACSPAKTASTQSCDPFEATGGVAYLDWAASAPMHPQAIDAMLKAANAGFANPTGRHHAARASLRLVDDARDQIAAAVGVRASSVIFCGSGTEADNLAIFGTASQNKGVILCSAIEHHAVLDPVEKLGGRLLAVKPNGQVCIDSLAKTCQEIHAAGEKISLVSVMAANNETGVIQPIKEIRETLDEHAPEAMLHSDAIQGFCWLDPQSYVPYCDLVSLSAHKFGGPKGVGALIVKDRSRMSAYILGGGQEFKLRSGTHNVASIAAAGVAAEITTKDRAAKNAKIAQLRDRLITGVAKAVGELTDVYETGAGNNPVQICGPGFEPNSLKADRSQRVPAVAHLCFPAIESESILFLLEEHNVAASAASSCASGAQMASHVLHAMGYHEDFAKGALRLSLGYGSNEESVDTAIEAIAASVAQIIELTAQL